MTGISKSQVSRLCVEIDEPVDAFLDRPLEGEWPCLWLDATHIKVRRSGRIVSVAAIVAVAVNTDGRREVLAYKTFPQSHWRQIHSTNPLERLNKEIKRRTNVVGIFPNEPAIRRLVGALMLEQNDEWAVTRRYMTLETVAAICDDHTMDPAKIAAL